MQRIITTENMRTVFEHNKTQYPCIEIDDPLSSRAASIQSLLSELTEIEIGLILLIANEDHELIRYISKALVISYGRLFSDSQRKYKIRKEDIKRNLSKLELEKHEYIIKMRNTYIAHADISDREEYKSFLILSPINGPMSIVDTYHQRKYNIGLLKKDYEERLNIVILLKEHLENEFKIMGEKIVSMYQEKDIGELYKLSELTAHFPEKI